MSSEPAAENTSLIPYEQVKRMDFEANGLRHLFEYNSGYITEEQRRLLNQMVEFKFIVGAHGTDAEHFLAIERAIETEVTSPFFVICFESAGFSLIEESNLRDQSRNATFAARFRSMRDAFLNSRNSVGSNYMTSTNAFYFAQKCSFSLGVDVRFVDSDAWQFNNTKVYAEAANSQDEETVGQVYSSMLSADWKKYDLVEATTILRRRLQTATALLDNGRIDPLLVPHWTRTQMHREKDAVHRMVNLALDKLLEIGPLINGDKLQMITFFGGAHRRGIQKRFEDMGLALKMLRMTDEPILSASADVELDGEDVRAFAIHWIAEQLYEYIGHSDRNQNSEHFHNQVAATKSAFELMPLSEIFFVYDTFRNAVNYYDVSSPSNTETNLQRAVREFRSKRMNIQTIFQDILLTAMSKSGVSLAVATEQYIAERQLALRQLYGQA